jgi:Domain of unknown function (DUF4412)
MFRINLKTVLLSFLAILSFQVSVFCQNHFQGKVNFQVTEGGKSSTLNYFVKDKKFRMESPSDKGAFIFDAATNKMLILMDEQKMYMEMPMDMNNMMKESTEKATGDFKATGEKKEILGYTCEKFIYTDENTKNEMWLTKDLGGFMFFNNPKEMQGSESDWQHKLLSEGYFPMVVKELESSGTVKSTFEVKGLEKMDLKDSFFTPPSEYKKFSMPSMDTGK